MWNLAKGKEFLPDVSVRQLRQFSLNETNAKAQLRLLCAVHRKKGKSIDEIAYVLDRPRRTIHGWLTKFQERGIKAKDSIKQPGRPPALSQKQRGELVKILERGPPHNRGGLWTTKQVKDLLKRKYGVEFVNQHVWWLLTTLGFALQRPRKQHYKRPGKEELLQFKKKRGAKPGTIAPKGLLWALRMRQRSDSSPSSPEVGRGAEAVP